MAFLIPENLRTRNDVPPGVAMTARVLRETLDDSATVWYEPLFDGSGERPDLVVLVPDVGILVLEVVESKAGMVAGVHDGKVVLRRGAAEEGVDDPLSRATSFADKLRGFIEGEPVLAPEERLPVAAVGVFAYLSRPDAEQRRLGEGIDLGQCLLRDELEVALREPASFERQIFRLIGGGLREPLSADAEKRHRALIHPETVIGSPRLPFPSSTPEDEIKVLDREQESLAKTLGAGHRVIRGVAGSGKTLVLTYRARLLAENFPRHKVLVTCFNRSLAGSLKRQLDLRNVHVLTIDHLLADVRRAAGLPRIEHDGTDLRQRAHEVLSLLDAGDGSLPKYDHVLVDEAQDFPTDALQFVVRLLQDGSDSLLVVADAAQNIYRNSFTWKAAGIQAAGRTRVLDRSYRNTREILDYAHTFLLGGGDLRTDDGSGAEDETVIIPPKTSDRSGPLPLFLLCDTPQQEVLEIGRRCRALINEGVTPGEIGILYGSSNAADFHWPAAISKLFKQENLPLFWVTDPTTQNKDHFGSDASKITLSTIYSAKGFEFRHVFLCGYLDDRTPLQARLNRRLIYVGMTRATHELVLTASGNHPYIADLET